MNNLQLFDDETFYLSFLPDLVHAKNEIYIESPYITIRKTRMLLLYFRNAIRRQVKIVIVTRFPQEHDKTLEIQTKESVKLLKDVGITVIYYGKLHRKIAIIDRRILWEGSLNILSQVYSAEIMRRIDNREQTEQIIDFLGLSRLI